MTRPAMPPTAVGAVEPGRVGPRRFRMWNGRDGQRNHFFVFFSEFQCFLYVLFYVLLDLRKCAEIGRRGELFHCVIESMFLLGLLNSMFSTISDFISASSRLFSTFPFPI